MFVRVDDASPQVKYGSTGVNGSAWSDDQTGDKASPSYYNGTFHGTTQEGDFARYSFYGDSIQVFGSKWFNHGIYTVQFDSDPPENFNGLSESRVIQALLYEKKNFSWEPTLLFVLSFPQIKLKLQTVTNRPSLSRMKTNGEGWLDIDYFAFGNSEIVEQDIKTVLWDDTSPQIRYAGDWAAGTTQLGKLVNATAQVSQKPGSSFSFDFTGISVQIVGATNFDHGNYSIELDGVKQVFSGKSSIFIVCPIFTATGLENKNHTLTAIAVSGTLDVDFVLFNSTGPDAPGAAPTGSDSQFSSSQKSSNIGAIAGGVAGGAVALAVLGLLIFFLLKRKRKRVAAATPMDLNGDEIQPFESMSYVGDGAGASFGNGLVSAKDPDHSHRPFLSIPPAPSSNVSSYPRSHNHPSITAQSPPGVDPFSTPAEERGLPNPFGTISPRSEESYVNVSPVVGHLYAINQGSTAIAAPQTFGQLTPEPSPASTPTLPAPTAAKRPGVILPYTAMPPNATSTATASSEGTETAPRISEEAMSRARMKVEGREVDAGPLPAALEDGREDMLPPGYEQATQPLPGQIRT